MKTGKCIPHPSAYPMLIRAMKEATANRARVKKDQAKLDKANKKEETDRRASRVETLTAHDHRKAPAVGMLKRHSGASKITNVRVDHGALCLRGTAMDYADGKYINKREVSIPF